MLTLALTVGFLLLLFAGGLWSGTYVSDIRLALVVFGGVACAVWLAAALLKPRWLPSSQLAAALAASLVTFAISAAAAWQLRLGLDYLCYAVLLAALYLMLVRLWAEPFLARRFDALIAILTVGTAIAYLVEVGSSWVAYWQLLRGFAVPPLRPAYAGLWLGNPNALASLLILLYLHMVAATGTGTRRRRLLLGALGLLVAFDVLLSGSRGAWLGLALALLAGAGVWLLIGGNRARLHALAGQPRLRAGAAGILAVAIVGATVLGPAIADRLSAGAVEVRTVFWAASVRMVEEQPLTGLGPGSWVPARLSHTLADELDHYVPHAHNVPLQVAAEFGALGIAAAAVVVLLLARLVRRGLQHPMAEARAFGWAVMLGTVYLLGQSLVDAYIHQPAILLALALPISRLDSLVVGDWSAPSGVRLRRKRVLAAVLLGAVVISTFVAADREGPAKSLEQAAADANLGNWQEALVKARRAATEDPGLAPHALLYGLAAARAGDLDTAVVQLTAAAEQDDFAPAWLDLAAVRFRLGHPDDARAALKRALRLGYQHPQIAAAAAGLYRELGDVDEAADALAWAWVHAPSLASDPLWQTPAWRDIVPAAANAAHERLGDTMAWFRLALELGDTAGAIAIADRLGEDAALAARAWQGDAAAFDLLANSARSRPLDGSLVGLCRRVASVGRDLGHGPWSCDGTAPTDAYPVVRVGEPLPNQVMAGRGLQYHAPYGYRRVLPQDLLVPWLVRLRATSP